MKLSLQEYTQSTGDLFSPYFGIPQIEPYFLFSIFNNELTFQPITNVKI